MIKIVVNLLYGYYFLHTLILFNLLEYCLNLLNDNLFLN
jgi:hypothetical protein